VYLTFFQLVARQLRVALGDAVAYESERRRAIALTELDEDKSRFYQNVSHEFRTPLTLILGPLSSVLEDTDSQLSPRHRDSLQTARRAGVRLRKLVDNLLEFSRVDADELHAQFEPTDLSTLTAELASMFRSVVERAGLEYVIEVADLENPIDVDREMWSEIVLNLLSNAVKFTQQGSIRVSLASAGDRVRLTVCDTGIGIPAVQLPHIFERFTQVPGQSGRSAEGTGIGLALVAAWAAAHGGEAEAQSRPGKGTTLTVWIPKSASVERTLVPAAVRMGEAATGAYLVEAESWLRPDAVARRAGSADATIGRLLLVEDNVDMRAYLQRLLTDDGWDVQAVDTVDAAVQVDPPPDIIVSDIMLPGRSGLELVRMMRADPDLRRIPIILLTARTGSVSAAEGLQSGADDYVVKPFDSAELLARIRVHHELATLREFALNQAEEKATNLQAALASNRQIGIAMGVLMMQGKLTEEQAFDRLREVSQHENRKLRDVADEIVLTGSVPTPRSARDKP
ncbi:MAG: ATP-binding protein, partial [Jatrophihabitantaceae bacterium]